MPTYVPPHMRKVQSDEQVTSSVADRPRAYDRNDIGLFLNVQSIQIHTFTVSPPADPATDKGELRGIVLYRNQHPDWDSSHQVLCKSNLDILQDIGLAMPLSDESGSPMNDMSPPKPVYPVFEQTKGVRKGRFSFAGWFRISSIEILEAHSPRLIDIFSRKLGVDGKESKRSVEGWRDSFSHPWAVVTLEKDKTRLDLPRVPKHSRPPERSNKVNELLKASREAARNPPMVTNAAQPDLL